MDIYRQLMINYQIGYRLCGNVHVLRFSILIHYVSGLPQNNMKQISTNMLEDIDVNDMYPFYHSYPVFLCKLFGMNLRWTIFWLTDFLSKRLPRTNPVHPESTKSPDNAQLAICKPVLWLNTLVPFSKQKCYISHQHLSKWDLLLRDKILLSMHLVNVLQIMSLCHHGNQSVTIAMKWKNGI